MEIIFLSLALVGSRNVYSVVNISSFRKRRVVDIGWAFGFIISAWIAFLLGDGLLLRKMALASFVTIWAGRLTYHLAKRTLTSPEHPCYREIRKKWPQKQRTLNFWASTSFRDFLSCFFCPFFSHRIKSFSIFLHRVYRINRLLHRFYRGGLGR